MPKRSAEDERASPAAWALALACAIALACALWALFQWSELRVARAGGDSFCGFGGGGDCAEVWDSPLAQTISDSTRLPVAGWGLAWALAAFAFPLLSLMRRAAGGRADVFTAAGAWAAIGGAAAVAGLAATLVLTGEFCATCAVTHALVLAYAAVTLAAGARPVPGVRGAGLALAGVVAASFVLVAAGWTLSPAPTREADLPAPRAAAGSEALEQFLASLSPPALQALADDLALHRASPEVPLRAPRALLGSPEAPVRITEFADALCGHCAALHRALTQLRERAPANSFSLEPRQFPLDGACNPHIPQQTEDAVRCLAARSLICMEGRPEAFAFAGQLFERQRSLDADAILEAAAPYRREADLRDCLQSGETDARLRDDITWAMEHGIRGTPLVLVNGREAPTSPQLLYALVLAGGDARHPAFGALPPASQSASAD